MNLATGSVSKGDFAVMLGVSPGRVSQYIAEGKIFGDALEGEGRRAKINPAIAQAQLQKTLEPGQRFGANGTALRTPQVVTHPAPSLFSERPATATSTPAPQTDAPTPQVDELAQLRIRRERIKTEQAEREELLETGKYMLKDDALREMAKAIGTAFSVMDQGLQQISEALSEQFSIPQRDVHHALVKAFRKVRADRAEEFKNIANELPDTIEDVAS